MSDFNFRKFGEKVQPSTQELEYKQIVQKFSTKVEEKAFIDDTEGLCITDKLEKSDDTSDLDDKQFGNILSVKDEKDFDLVTAIIGTSTSVGDLNVALIDHEDCDEKQRSVKSGSSNHTPVPESGEDCKTSLENFIENQSEIDLKCKAFIQSNEQFLGPHILSENEKAEDQGMRLMDLKNTKNQKARQESGYSFELTLYQQNVVLGNNIASVGQNKVSSANDLFLVGVGTSRASENATLLHPGNASVDKYKPLIHGNASVDKYKSLIHGSASVPANANNGSNIDQNVLRNSRTLTPPEPPDPTHYTISPELKKTLDLLVKNRRNSQLRHQQRSQGDEKVIAKNSHRFHPYQQSLPNLPEFK